MAVSGYTSAEPLLALLKEDEPELKGLALETLNEHIHEFWSEIAPSVSYIEELSESDSFEYRQLASVVASKLYYHLGSFNDALRCALNSPTIKTSLSSSIVDDEYLQAILSQCIETYVEYQRAVYLHNSAIIHKQNLSFDDEHDDGSGDAFTSVPVDIPPHPEPIDPRIADLIEYLVRLHVSQGHHIQSIGICIESLRLDLIREVLLGAPAHIAAKLMKETFQAAIHTVDIPLFKNELLSLLVELYRAPSQTNDETPEADPTTASTTDTTTTSTDETAGTTGGDDEMTSDSNKKPIPKDLNEVKQMYGVVNELKPSKETSLHVVSDIISLCQCLQALSDATALAAVLNELIGSTNEDDHLLAYQVAFDLCQYQQIAFTSSVAQLICDDETLSSASAASLANASSTTPPSTLPNATPITTNTAPLLKSSSTASNDKPVSPRVNVYQILTGRASAELHSHFLYHNCHDDKEWFTRISPAYIRRPNTIPSFFVAYSFGRSGTHREELFREYWDTAESTTLWSKFTTRASLGSIYRGQYDRVKDILTPFLPDPSGGMSNSSNAAKSYAQGGTLYALGLATCGVKNNHLPYLLQVLNQAAGDKNEPMLHGASLAIGLCGIGNGDEAIYESLRSIMWEDQPVAGQGAAIAAGLLMVGHGNSPDKALIVKELVAFARSCPHEKIVHGVGLALALMFFGLTHVSEPVSATLRNDSSPKLRWAAVWIDAMAYCGTGNLTVVNRLLDLAVTETDSDIVRTALMALGFVMLHEGDQLAELIGHMVGSYSPSIRYGVAMALGISCSGFGSNSKAYNIIQYLFDDREDSVVQGGFIAAAMVLSQTSDDTVKKFEEKLLKRVTADGILGIGAIYAAGILRCGGRSAEIRLLNQFNQKRTIAICGMLLFCQYWFWHPFSLTFCLTLSPTAIIAVDKTLLIPSNLKFVANVSKKLMSFPVEQEKKTSSSKKKVTTNALSISKRHHNRISTALSRVGSFASDILSTPSLTNASSSIISSMKDDNDDSSILLAGAPIDGETGLTQEQQEKAKEKQERAERRKKEKEMRLPVHVLPNCSRVLPKYVDRIWCPKQRFVPVKTRLYGIVLVRDSDPNAGEFELDSLSFPSLTPGSDIDINEPQAPEPFALPCDMADGDGNTTSTATIDTTPAASSTDATDTAADPATTPGNPENVDTPEESNADNNNNENNNDDNNNPTSD